MGEFFGDIEMSEWFFSREDWWSLKFPKWHQKIKKKMVTIGIMKQSWKDVLCRIFTGRLFWGPEVSWTV